MQGRALLAGVAALGAVSYGARIYQQELERTAARIGEEESRVEISAIYAEMTKEEEEEAGKSNKSDAWKKFVDGSENKKL